ncbi:hypothetical protein E2C01_012455 [Portunus trituberculatus]|uniref:Uncharacterized protein n=1 Tax=Portunus trituberculatus TaxID=210409 RepID=A0A5B7DDX3_PORTR|nr:hypothetical protein [Portunus trituberculatus]
MLKTYAAQSSSNWIVVGRHKCRTMEFQGAYKKRSRGQLQPALERQFSSFSQKYMLLLHTLPSLEIKKWRLHIQARSPLLGKDHKYPQITLPYPDHLKNNGQAFFDNWNLFCGKNTLYARN